MPDALGGLYADHACVGYVLDGVPEAGKGLDGGIVYFEYYVAFTQAGLPGVAVLDDVHDYYAVSIGARVLFSQGFIEVPEAHLAPLELGGAIAGSVFASADGHLEILRLRRTLAQDRDSGL